jgi:hypothetical protein
MGNSCNVCNNKNDLEEDELRVGLISRPEMKAQIKTTWDYLKKTTLMVFLLAFHTNNC